MSALLELQGVNVFYGGIHAVRDLSVSVNAGEVVTLTTLEFDALYFMASRAGRVFSREQLLEHIWGRGYLDDGRLVDVHVRRLRMKVEADPANPRHVVTVRGLGYRLQS